MSDRVDNAFTHLKQHAANLGVPAPGHFDKHVRNRVLDVIRLEQQPTTRRSFTRRRTIWGSAAALVLAVCGAAAWVTSITVQHSRNTGHKDQPVAQTPSYPAFTPPPNMKVAHEYPAPSGGVKVVTYTQTRAIYSQGPPGSDQTFLVADVGGVEKLLYQMPALRMATAKPAYWYKAGNAMYTVMESTCPSANGLPNLALCIVKLTPVSGSWKVETVIQDNQYTGIPFGTTVNVDGRLLTCSSAVGTPEPPTWYDFTSQGVTATPVTAKWPEPGSIPHGQVYAFTVPSEPVSPTTMNGPATAVYIRGPQGHIHLHVGDTLVVEEQGSPTPVIVSVDDTDPMHMTDRLYPSNAFQWLPLPYTQATLFKMTKPFKGALQFSIQIDPSSNEVVANYEGTYVPIDVSP